MSNSTTCGPPSRESFAPTRSPQLSDVVVEFLRTARGGPWRGGRCGVPCGGRPRCPYRCAMTDERPPPQVFPNRFPEAVDSRPGVPQDRCHCFSQGRVSPPGARTSFHGDIQDTSAPGRLRLLVSHDGPARHGSPGRWRPTSCRSWSTPVPMSASTLCHLGRRATSPHIIGAGRSRGLRRVDPCRPSGSLAGAGHRRPRSRRGWPTRRAGSPGCRGAVVEATESWNPRCIGPGASGRTYRPSGCDQHFPDKP